MGQEDVVTVAQVVPERLAEPLREKAAVSEEFGDGALLLEKETVTVVLLVPHSDTEYDTLALLERLEL